MLRNWTLRAVDKSQLIRVIRMWWSHLSKLKPLRVSRKWWSPFSMVKTVRVVRKWWRPFFNIKNFRSRKTVMEFFLSFKIFKSRKKLIESFFNGLTSLSFRMMHKFPGTTFDYIGTTLEQNFKIVRNNRDKIVRNNRLELSVTQLFRRFLEIPVEKRL